MNDEVSIDDAHGGDKQVVAQHLVAQNCAERIAKVVERHSQSRPEPEPEPELLLQATAERDELPPHNFAGSPRTARVHRDYGDKKKKREVATPKPRVKRLDSGSTS
eukprot:COSAG04_NODE_24730_length_317_cov_1.412844_1_plen_105_part_11